MIMHEHVCTWRWTYFSNIGMQHVQLRRDARKQTHKYEHGRVHHGHDRCMSLSMFACICCCQSGMRSIMPGNHTTYSEIAITALASSGDWAEMVADVFKFARIECECRRMHSVSACLSVSAMSVGVCLSMFMLFSNNPKWCLSLNFKFPIAPLCGAYCWPSNTTDRVFPPGSLGDRSPSSKIDRKVDRRWQVLARVWQLNW